MEYILENDAVQKRQVQGLNAATVEIAFEKCLLLKPAKVQGFMPC